MQFTMLAKKEKRQGAVSNSGPLLSLFGLKTDALNHLTILAPQQSYKILKN